MADDNHIVMFLHCGQCIKERPSGESPQTYSRLECGWTKEGIQLYCKRHNLNVIHIDFKSSKQKILSDNYKLKKEI